MFVLTGCGGGGADSSGSEDQAPAQAEAAPSPSPEELYPATIDPCLIHPGSVNDLADPNGDTSDYWYADGDVSNEYFFYLVQTRRENSNIGLNITYCKWNGEGYLFANTALQTEDNLHAKSEQPVSVHGEDPVEFDLTFQDDFTCYDFVSGTVYKRAHRELGCKDQAWYDAAIVDTLAWREFATDRQQFSFTPDHRFVEQYLAKPSGEATKEITGTWAVKGSNVLWLVYDNPEDSGYQSMDVTEAYGWEKVEGLEDKMQALDEIRPAIWPMEFEISADGQITGFGMTPVYNAEYTETIGYESAFEVASASAVAAEQASAAESEAAAAAAEEQAKEDAKNSGSPYAQPDDLNDLSTVNLDQTPDLVVVSGELDYDSFHKFKDDWSHHNLDVYVVQLTCMAKITSAGRLEITTENEKGSQKESTWVYISDGDAPEVEEGSIVTVTGVVWDRQLHTDLAHVTLG